MIIASDFDGTLTGLRIFALNIDYLRREMLSNSHSANSEFAAARPGEYAVTLVDRTMRVVARSPWTDTDVGISMTKSEIIRGLIASQADRFAASFRNVLTGNETIGAVQWLAGRRFAIVTTGPASEVLKPWRKEALGIVTLSFIVFAGMALVGVQTARNERRQAKDAARLAAANAELLAQTKRAEASTIAKGNFLANMSHEIRTPLTGIIGYSGLALEDRALSGETRHYMTLVHSASTNLRKIIDDILDLGKIESGKIDVASSPFSLRDAVDTCVALAKPVAAVKGLELRKRFDMYEAEGNRTAEKGLVLPTYDHCLKCSHTFNLLNARGAISVAERTSYIGRVRNLARLSAESYLRQRESLGYPLRPPLESVPWNEKC